MKPIICAAAVIRRGDRILIAQRESDSRLEPLKWEFPGGKIEFTEEPRLCLEREIKEEIDFEIEVNDIFEVVSHNYHKNGETYHVLLLCYLCTYLRGQPRPIECNDIRWVGADDIGAYDFAAADVPIVAKIRDKLWIGKQ
ncbi:MAG: (deoxy)nucleoside triphosphate pyrophosphohydrolase [bacterium]